MDVFKYLSDMVASIKRFGAILAGDEAGDGWEWQRVALYQAHEMHHYATMLERIAAGKEGGGVVFPSWDEGADGKGGDVFAAVESLPMPPESAAGVPKSGFLPPWSMHPWGDADIEIVDATGSTVCNVPDAGEPLDEGRHQRIEANARLIAAAPALLASCEALIAADDENNEVGKSVSILAIRNLLDDAGWRRPS